MINQRIGTLESVFIVHLGGALVAIIHYFMAVKTGSARRRGAGVHRSARERLRIHYHTSRVGAGGQFAIHFDWLETAEKS
jgi:hypothetical protein